MRFCWVCGSVGLSRQCSLTPWWWVVVAGVVPLALGRGIGVHGGRRHCPPFVHENLLLVPPAGAPAASSFFFFNFWLHWIFVAVRAFL